MDVSDWLRQLGLERYEAVFRDNEIDWDVLPELTEGDLKELGIPLGPRKKLLKAIAGLSVGPDPASTEPMAPPTTAAPEAERRQLTVLFCDLVGSTELATSLDPEDMGAVIRAYHAACQDVVTRWGGHVAKFMGDGVLAYFGYPHAHEDDAERAVRAGIDLAAVIEGLKTHNDTSLAGRIGIATGLVMVGELIGEGAAQEHTVVGDTPNLAARLQALAAPGAVVVAASTRRLLGGLFEIDDLGQQKLKGFTEPVRAFRIVAESRAESRFEALHGQHLTPLVGREHEIGLLLDRWERAKDGEGQVVLLSGEPGIGKSRIVRALRERLGDEPYTPLSHYCSPFHVNSALHPVIGLLERSAGFARNDKPDVRLTKLEGLLSLSSDDLDEVVPLVASLLGVPIEGKYSPLELAPQRQRQRTLEVLVDQVEGLARREPVLATYEDVHWADPTTLEILDSLIERVQRLPVLAPITFRPDFSPRWTGHAHVTQLSLSRLTRRHGGTMIERLTGGKALPAEIMAQIVERTDGVPLFVEELTKSVLESGMLRDAGDHFELDGPLLSPAIPSSLHDSLMARLDRLAPVKEVAQIGSVIGREFSHELLAAVADRPEAELTAALDRLIASQLVFRRGTPPEATYSFKHALIQDAAYESLLKSRRQQLHARSAQVLAEWLREGLGHEPEVVAHHYTEAGLAVEAVAYWLQASQRARQRSADAEAVVHLTRGLEMLKTLPGGAERIRQELRLQLALAQALFASRGYGAPETARAYARACELAGTAGELRSQFEAIYGAYATQYFQGHHAAGFEAATESLRLAERLGDAGALCIGHRNMAVMLNALGRFAEAQIHAEGALGLYDVEKHRALAIEFGHDVGVASLAHLSFALWHLGYPTRAAAAVDRALTLGQGHEQANARVHCHFFPGALAAAFARNMAALEAHADALVILAREHGFPQWAAFGTALQGPPLTERGQPAAAIERMTRGLDACRRVGAEVCRPIFLGFLAEAYAEAGRIKESLAAVDRALARIGKTQERWHEAELWRIKGQLLRLLADRAGAEREACFRRAIEVACRQGARLPELRGAVSLAQLWAEQGERRKAHDLLAPVYGWFSEGFDTQDLIDAKRLVDELT